MAKWIDELNALNKGVKFVVRILYPIALFTILYLIGTVLLEVSIQNIQIFFILIWGFIEWRVFFSYKGRKEE